jgi:2-furoyl-CoA dehydrogenase large subunit
MKVEGGWDVLAPRHRVWSVLRDPLQTAPLVPGAEIVETLAENRWRVRARLPLGILKPTLNADLERTEERPPEHAALRADGKGLGFTLQMETAFTLTGDERTTHVAWAADIALGGRLGALGERVLRPLVEHQVVAMLRRLEAELAESPEGERQRRPH